MNVWLLKEDPAPISLAWVALSGCPGQHIETSEVGSSRDVYCPVHIDSWHLQQTLGVGVPCTHPIPTEDMGAGAWGRADIRSTDRSVRLSSLDSGGNSAPENKGHTGLPKVLQEGN